MKERLLAAVGPILFIDPAARTRRSALWQVSRLVRELVPSGPPGDLPPSHDYR